jgi:hypothetical protein
MINNRPKHLLNQDTYKELLTKAFAVHFETLPELVRQALGPLGGIQPVTREMTKAAGGILHDVPSEGEIELFREKGVVFQMISLVLNVAHLKEVDGVTVATPYSLSMMPASKRGSVDERSIDLVAKLNAPNFLKEFGPSYADFDPFTGDFGLYGPLSLFIGEKPVGCFLDELGIVIGQYFLAKNYDAADVLEVPMGFSTDKAEEKYKKHRAKLLYTPFSKIEPRRVWGAQSPIELFLFQELLRRDLSPLLQVLVFDDGSIHPSLYDLWRDVDFRYVPCIISEPDMYFADKKLAVFCDSGRFHRGKTAEAKDAAIDKKLAAIGISSVRIPGKLIVEDVQAAGDLVANAISD